MATKAKTKAQRKPQWAKPWLGKRGSQHPRSKPVITPFGRFESQALAAAALGVSPGLIWQRVAAGRPGYRYAKPKR